MSVQRLSDKRLLLFSFYLIIGQLLAAAADVSRSDGVTSTAAAMPAVAENPKSSLVYYVGGSTVIECRIEGIITQNSNTYFWFYPNQTAVQDDDQSYRTHSRRETIKSGPSSTEIIYLIFSDMRISDTGQYSCAAADETGGKSTIKRNVLINVKSRLESTEATKNMLSEQDEAKIFEQGNEENKISNPEKAEMDFKVGLSKTTNAQSTVAQTLSESASNKILSDTKQLLTNSGVTKNDNLHVANVNQNKSQQEPTDAMIISTDFESQKEPVPKSTPKPLVQTTLVVTTETRPKAKFFNNRQATVKAGSIVTPSTTVLQFLYDRNKIPSTVRPSNPESLNKNQKPLSSKPALIQNILAVGDSIILTTLPTIVESPEQPLVALQGNKELGFGSDDAKQSSTEEKNYAKSFANPQEQQSNIKPSNSLLSTTQMDDNLEPQVEPKQEQDQVLGSPGSAPEQQITGGRSDSPVKGDRDPRPEDDSSGKEVDPDQSRVPTVNFRSDEQSTTASSTLLVVTSPTTTEKQTTTDVRTTTPGLATTTTTAISKPTPISSTPQPTVPRYFQTRPVMVSLDDDYESIVPDQLQDGENEVDRNEDTLKTNGTGLLLGIALAAIVTGICAAVVLYRLKARRRKSKYIAFGNPSYSREHLPANDLRMDHPLTLSSHGYTVLA